MNSECARTRLGAADKLKLADALLCTPVPNTLCAGVTCCDSYSEQCLGAGGSDSDAAVTERGGTSTAPSADSSDASAPVEATETGTATNATDAANATATVMQTIPVNAQLGSYDASIPLDVIPVAIAVLPSGKVWKHPLSFSSAHSDCCVWIPAFQIYMCVLVHTRCTMELS